jgi:hypothetical protein
MNFYASSQKEQELAKRIQRIVDLNCRRDQILLSSILDLMALEKLAGDYEAADMPCAATNLRKKLEWYKKIK